MYQLSHSGLPPRHPLLASITGEMVLYAFMLYGLLQDADTRSECLTLPHRGENRHRLKAALIRRNQRRSGIGQEMWSHACNLCLKIIKSDDGTLSMFPTILMHRKLVTFVFTEKIAAGVTDGVTVGRPCCSVHNCPSPLRNQNDRFCPDHQPFSLICAVAGCDLPAVAGRMSCSLETHSAAETAAREQNKAMGQLKARLAQREQRQIYQNSDEPDKHKKKRESKLSIRLTRRWTHNEQLFVRCCGIIISRQTFYGSESLINVKVCFCGYCNPVSFTHNALALSEEYIPTRISSCTSGLYILRQ